MVHKGSRYFHVLFYDTKHTSYTTLVIFFKLLRFLKTFAIKLLNGTTGSVGDIEHHHAEQFINLHYFPVVV